jgi:predicted 3-demethylubiquinone-9 3-methyltransferase (glyoxalase superfamily)
VSWQIIPRELLHDTKAEKAQRAMKAMLKMHKIEIAEIRKAFEGK